MSSIGPQLPPHLAKRKRTPGDDDDGKAPGSPQSKVQRRTNDDEIALDSDGSDDGFGPSAAPVKSQAISIGSSLPPAQNNNTPASKPTPATSSSQQASRSKPQPQPAQAPDSQPPKVSIGPSLPPKRILGPAPPPADLAERPPTSPDHEAEAEADSESDSESDSDDGYGPALPTASSRAAAATGASIGPSAQPAAPAAPQRDSWMLAPPPDRGYRVADPTQIKARKFTSGPRASGAGGGGGGGAGSSVWFETPEEKAKRLADAVLGRAADPTANNPYAPPPTAGAVKENGSSREQDERIRSFTEQTRGKSLYEEHQAAKAAGRGGKEEEEEEDDPSKRAFDREKDMALGSKITHSQRREMLNRAADFGGRFQKGKYL